MSIEDETDVEASEGPEEAPPPAARPRKSPRDRFILALGVIAVALAIFFVVHQLMDMAPSVSQSDIRSDLGVPDGPGDAGAAPSATQMAPNGTPADNGPADAPSSGDLTAPSPQTSQQGAAQSNPAMMGDGTDSDTPNQADRR